MIVGEKLNIQCCHDDYSIWFDATPQTKDVTWELYWLLFLNFLSRENSEKSECSYLGVELFCTWPSDHEFGSRLEEARKSIRMLSIRNWKYDLQISSLDIDPG